MERVFLVYPIATVAFILLHLAVSRKEKSAEFIWEIILIYALFFNVGITGLVAFFAHIFRPEEVAAFIGWPAGNPFQFEVACANLAFGVLGVLSVSLRGTFRLATIIGYSVFLAGTAFGHIEQMRYFNNYAPGNAGAPLLASLFTPIVLLPLWIVHYVIRKREKEKNAAPQPDFGQHYHL